MPLAMTPQSDAADLCPDAKNSDSPLSCVEDRKNADFDDASSAWEGLSDLPDEENMHNGESVQKSDNDSDSEWEGFEDNDYEWEGFSDLLYDVTQSSSPLNRGFLRYDVFVNKFGGIDTVQDQILGSLDSDLLKLFETGELCLETLKRLKTSKPRISNKPGTYIHVIYSPDNHDLTLLEVRKIGPRWI